jgi:hypothetical protein
MRTLKISVVFCILFLLVIEGPAQNREWGVRLRDRILQAKLNEIQKSLKLEPQAFERFKPIYIRYEKDIASFNLRDQGRIMRVNADSLTSEEAEKMVMLQIQNAKKMIALREKYYPEFKTVLRPQQIIKLYQTEAEIRRKVMQEMRRRFGRRFNE